MQGWVQVPLGLVTCTCPVRPGGLLTFRALPTVITEAVSFHRPSFWALPLTPVLASEYLLLTSQLTEAFPYFKKDVKT